MHPPRPRGRPRTRPDTPDNDALRAMCRDKYYANHLHTWISNALAHQRFLAKKLGIPCDITRDDVQAKIDEADGVCAITGITLNYQRGRKYAKPDSACIAMIDADGYLTRDNIRVISWQGKRQLGQQSHKTFISPKIAPLIFRLRLKQAQITRLSVNVETKQQQLNTLCKQLSDAQDELGRMQIELMEAIKHEPE